MINTSPLVLASQSPYRAQLLKQVGLNFITAQPMVDEEQLKKQFKGPSSELSAHLAEKKALSLKSQFPAAWIVGSDQVLLLDNQELSKPKNLSEVRVRLQQLNGKSHRLSTALCLITPTTQFTRTINADLTMRKLSDSEIDWAVELDKAVGCAGGYKIESHGLLLFSTIATSDHTSIIGLPMITLLELLRQTGFPTPLDGVYAP